MYHTILHVYIGNFNLTVLTQMFVKTQYVNINHKLW